MREKKMMVELLKNCKVSDRELAAKLQTSQPTITRLRNKLFNKGYISAFTIVPSLSKMGFDLMMFTFFQRVEVDARKALHEWVKRQPQIVFSAEGEGLQERTMVMVSAHPNFDDGKHFLNALRENFDQKVSGIGAFFAPIRATVKDFNLASVVESFVLKEEKPAKKGRASLVVGRNLFRR